MITFTTATGSKYEVDDANKQARRVTPGSHVIVRMTENWRKFIDRTEIVVGKSAWFEWGDETPPLIPGADDVCKCTVTSPVTAVVTS